jgi:hypothetical protein
VIGIFIRGIAIEDFFKVVNTEELTEKNSTILYSVFDKRFSYSTSFISGAPSVHVAFEEKNGIFCSIMYLDMKSITFSFTSENTLEKEIPLSLKKLAEKYILETNTIIATKPTDIASVIEDIKFFADYNIYVLGFASNSQERFDALYLDLSEIQCVFTREKTDRIKYNALLINYIAVESDIYEADNQHYIVPSVGIEGLELWLGTNPRFFLSIVDAADDDDKKTTKKYLYNMIFARVAKCLAEYFEIIHYSVSKVEKAFIIEDLSIEKIKELLKLLRVINSKAIELFNGVIKGCAIKLGVEIKNAEKKVKQLSTFYDESNIVGFVTMAYSDEDILHRKLIDILLMEIIPSLITNVESTVTYIDLELKKYINEGGDGVD